MAHVQKAKVSFSILKPKTVEFKLYKDAPYKLGVLVGSASGFKQKIDDRDGKEYVQLQGAFKMIIGHDASPSSPDSVSSGVCYMPDAWMNPIISALRGLGDSAAVGATVDFVYEVSIGKRGEQDYEWIVRDLRPPQAADPLAALMDGAVIGIEDKTEKAPEGAKSK